MSSQQSPPATRKVEQKAGQVADQAQQQADQLASKAKQQVSSQAESRKNQAAKELSSVADAVRQAGQQLREQQHGTVAHYAEMTAERVDRFSQSLQRRDVNQLVSEAEQLARQRPGLFVGGAFALGLLGARFLKSSSAPDGARTGSQAGTGQPYGYRPPMYSTGATPVGSVGTPRYPSPDTTAHARYTPDSPDREG